MSETNESKSNSGSQDPYELLGVGPDASFEEIQVAKEQKLLNAGENIIQKAKIESAYDSLLMVSLKERQQGKLSNDALNASEKEKSNNKVIGGIGSSLLTKLNRKSESYNNSQGSSGSILPVLNLPEGQGLAIRVSLGLLAFVSLLIAQDQNIDLILSLSTIALFISQIKRGRKPLPSLGWSVVLLSIGLIIGGLLTVDTGLDSTSLYSLSSEKIEALPALILLFLGGLLLD